MKTALITGVTGQDGHYLSSQLLNTGYRVFGLFRRTSQSSRIPEGIHPLEGDVTDASSLFSAMSYAQPDEVYHLAAQSHVHSSFKMPGATFEINAVGTLNVLETVRRVAPYARVYNAATSELYGDTEPPQDEDSLMNPRSPYAVAKHAAYELVRLYRDAYNLFACNGILFNHESPLRGDNFVTQKIALGAARIAWGKQDKLLLGNLDAERDWGHAEDYVRGMQLMLQHDQPDDYVLATGEKHSVKEFVRMIFAYFDLDWEKHVEVDPQFIRPAEVPALCGDPTKAERVLGWRRHYGFNELVRDMANAAWEREK